MMKGQFADYYAPWRLRREHLGVLVRTRVKFLTGGGRFALHSRAAPANPQSPNRTPTGRSHSDQKQPTSNAGRSPLTKHPTTARENERAYTATSKQNLILFIISQTAHQINAIILVADPTFGGRSSARRRRRQFLCVRPSPPAHYPGRHGHSDIIVETRTRSKSKGRAGRHQWHRHGHHFGQNFARW